MENNRIILSVIIPVFNVYPYIKKCLASILNQTVDKNCYEVLVVNDGSTDRSSEFLKSIGNKFENLRIYNRKNKGVSNSRNFGIEKSKGEFISFIDSDDWANENYIETLISYLNSYDPDVLSFGYYQDFKNNSKIKKYKSNFIIKNQLNIELFFKINLECSLYNIWNKVYRKSFIKKNNICFLDIKNGEDAIFNLEVYSKTLKSVFVTDKLYHYTFLRKGAASTSKDMQYLNDGCEVINYINSIFKEDKKKELLINYQSVIMLYSYVNTNFDSNKKYFEEQRAFIKSKFYRTLIPNVSLKYSAKNLNLFLKFLIVKVPFLIYIKDTVRR
ncbi:glycosyltransferase family 2 protein [Lactiplantibacillus plantarum]|nr:glycosyltransferase family 2 protein [Lactiplantibacillus plantarum]MCG0644314.1 glycosyltransferase family 2 protein [Lactiplantibacillus plantarum]MCG0647430.1 glycosyltransferase family 2 protein [Lactiplantibacillus plantarum]MCG0653604.1 glycosyltransferase family 2 protein [Lactiplantibacillus plantarum]MCG0786517.1 glycosyltransferase family 2 protein [Lactiplantibacillus plantarum]